MINHIPEDMTCTVDASITLAQLQARVGERGQWLPIDPPLADKLSIGELLATNVSGPRRFGCGTIREHVLGMKIRLADGRVIKSGGQVVKNVAGYDLCRLFIGSRGTLGEIVEATFKLRPLPEVERFVQRRCESLERAGEVIEAVIETEVTPVVLDLCSPAVVVVGFAGTREEVEWQLSRVAELGIREPSSLDYNHPMPQKTSVLPSRLVETLRKLGNATFIARAGNGVIYHDGDPMPRKQELTAKLFERVKAAYDPHNALPKLTL